jgi:deazaflavin-dependent oxidoreductase (nitroreductase family)
MLTVLALVGALLLGLVLTILIVFVLGMRAKTPWVLYAVRRFNRALGNPFQMRSAGTPGAYASVIRHVGRTSGRPYETPVVPLATDGGFVIALPYGSNTDWLKNVLASGSATIVNAGHTYRVDQPEIIPTEAAAANFPVKEQRSLRRFRIGQCLRVRRVDLRVDLVEAAGQLTKSSE